MNQESRPHAPERSGPGEADPDAVRPWGVDVIVVHHNRTDLTRRCLEALAQDSELLRSVTVVDSGSIKALQRSDLADELHLSALEGEGAAGGTSEFHLVSLRDNVGFAEANNLGLAARSGGGAAFFLVLNNDAYVTPGALRAMADAAETSGAAMVVPAVYQVQDPTAVDRFGLTLTRSGAAYDRKSEADGVLLCPSGCAAFYRRDLVLDLMSDSEGFFDRRFEAYAEDLDVGLRARARGYDVVFAAGARVLHVGGATFGPSSPTAHRLRHRNTMWAIAKNYSVGLLVRELPFLALGQFLGIVHGGLRGRLRATLRGKWEGVRGLRTFRRTSSGHQRLESNYALDSRFLKVPGTEGMRTDGSQS